MSQVKLKRQLKMLSQVQAYVANITQKLSAMQADSENDLAAATAIGDASKPLPKPAKVSKTKPAKKLDPFVLLGATKQAKVKKSDKAVDAKATKSNAASATKLISKLDKIRTKRVTKPVK